MRHQQITDELKEKARIYAAGEISQAEKQEFVRHLEDEDCEVCRNEVAKYEQTANSSSKQRSAIFQRWWVDFVAIVVAVAALIVLAASTYANRELRRLNETLASRIAQLEVQLQRQRNLSSTLTSPDVRVFDLAGQGTTAGASGRIFWNERQRLWLFYVKDLPPVASDRNYQLWFVPVSGNPIAAAVFNTEHDGKATLEIDVPQDVTQFKAAAVTTEPAGGSPQPTQPFALSGPM